MVTTTNLEGLYASQSSDELNLEFESDGSSFEELDFDNDSTIEFDSEFTDNDTLEFEFEGDSVEEFGFDTIEPSIETIVENEPVNPYVDKPMDERPLDPMEDTGDVTEFKEEEEYSFKDIWEATARLSSKEVALMDLLDSPDFMPEDGYNVVADPQYGSIPEQYRDKFLKSSSTSETSYLIDKLNNE